MLEIHIRLKKSRLYQQLLDAALADEAARLAAANQYRALSEILPALARNTALAMANGNYEPAPPEVFEQRAEGKTRRMARFGPAETVLVGALSRLLSKAWESAWLPQCIGGRRGTSRHSFHAVLEEARRRKAHWVLITDVAGYYESIDRVALDRVLREPPFRLAADIRRLALSMAGGGAGERGILAGHALATPLANAFLHGADRHLCEGGQVFCRYIDDFAVFCTTRKAAERALEGLVDWLARERGLVLSAPKTRLRHRYQEGFDFLGFKVIGNSLQPSEANIARFAEQLSAFVERSRRKSLRKVVRGLNRRIHWFGHQYKRGRVGRIFSRLDQQARAALRRYLTACGAPTPGGCFLDPRRFPSNLAYQDAALDALGLASLARIKAGHDARGKAPAPTRAKPEIVEISPQSGGLLRIVLRAVLDRPHLQGSK